jgi:hypothetical protein
MDMHGIMMDVQLISQAGIVASNGLLLKVPAFTSLKNLINLLRCNAWGMRWTALLCLAILSPLMCWFVNSDKRCGHVSMLLLGHSMQLGFGCVIGTNFPIYCVYLNFKVWVFCMSEHFQEG